MRLRSARLSRHTFPSGSIGQWVVGVLGLAVGGVFCLAGYAFFNPSGSGMKFQATEMEVMALQSALKMYKVENGTYPTTQQGLMALVQRPTIEPIPVKWTQLMSRTKPDPWGNEYIYQFPGDKNPEEFVLISRGPDGKLGSEDDITNQNS